VATPERDAVHALQLELNALIGDVSALEAMVGSAASSATAAKLAQRSGDGSFEALLEAETRLSAAERLLQNHRNEILAVETKMASLENAVQLERTKVRLQEISDRTVLLYREAYDVLDGFQQVYDAALEKALPVLTELSQEHWRLAHEAIKLLEQPDSGGKPIMQSNAPSTALYAVSQNPRMSFVDERMSFAKNLVPDDTKTIWRELVQPGQPALEPHE